ncbi:MAG: PIN domain-containing protein [Microbacterium sp.]
MIVLDASVLIAHLAEEEVHGERAFEILDSEDDLLVHPMTLAESLVGPVRTGLESDVLQTFERLGIERLRPAADEPLVLARLRATTSLKIPDCCVLATALEQGATLATFDSRLAQVARAMDVEVVGA